MMPLDNLLIFIVQGAFDFFTLMLLLRFLLQLVRADFYNPISQRLIKLTNPLTNPLRVIIKGFSRMDFASLVAALILKVLLLYSILFISTGEIANLSYYLVFRSVLFSLVYQFLNIYFYSFIILAIASWVAPFSNNSILILIHQITEPLANKVRQFIPPFGGLDFSFMAIIFFITAIQHYLLKMMHFVA